MPRAYSQVAEIIDRIEQTRLNIQELTQSLEVSYLGALMKCCV